MEYKASPDKWVKIITLGLIPIFVVVTLTVMFLTQDRGLLLHTSKYSLITVVLIILATYIITFLLMPIKYVVDPGFLTIVRPFKNVVIERNEIKNVNTIDPIDMKWTFRLFGNGGLFGYYGLFTNRKFGRMTWYAKQKRNYIMITLMGNKKIVLTPDDLSMVEALKN